MFWLLGIPVALGVSAWSFKVVSDEIDETAGKLVMVGAVALGLYVGYRLISKGR